MEAEPLLGNWGIFREAYARVVLSWAANVFADQFLPPPSSAAPKRKSDHMGRVAATSVDAPHIEEGNRTLTQIANIDTPTNELEEHGAADAVWNRSVPTSRCYAFVSHVWAASRWLKWLALCMYVNFPMAATACGCTAAVAFAYYLFPLYPTGFDLVKADLYLDGQVPSRCCFIPVFVFLFFFFFGHNLRFGSFAMGLWIDKLCIHQSRADLKTKGVKSLHEFVSGCDRLLVLWSESYFERLWCMCELGTFGAKGCLQRIDFIPLWFGPFVVGSMLASLAGLFAMPVLMPYLLLIAEWSATNIHPETGGGAIVTCAVSTSNLLGVPLYMFLFRYKIRCAKGMFEQFKNFSLKNTKCFFESDRPVVYGIIAKIWGKDDEDEADAIQKFDDFVTGPLLEGVQARVGKDEARVPYLVNLLAHLPMGLWSMADVLICDAANCADAAATEGIKNPYHYMLTQTITNVLFFLVLLPWMCPMMLDAMCKINRCGNDFTVIPLQILALAAIAFFNGLLVGTFWMGLKMYLQGHSWVPLMVSSLIHCLAFWRYFA